MFRAVEPAASENSSTLPSTWYTNPTVLEQERDRIYRCSWQYAGPACRLESPGSFVTCRAGEVPVLVLRDSSGRLRAYINVCPHRGSQLINEECGARKSLQCSYHAWTWSLEGTLRAAPGTKEEPNFDPADFGLLPAQASTWGPFLFVNPDPAAPPLEDVLGELPDLVTSTGLDLGGLRRRNTSSYDIAANWKVVVDNYLECYHCPVAHPAFSQLIDVSNYRVREYRYFSTQGGPQKDTHRARPYGIGDGVEEGFYAFLWPNFTLNVYPGPGNVSINHIVPLDVDHTRIEYEYWFADSVDDPVAQEFVGFVDQVQQEDTALCESVQRGLRSGSLPHGRLILSRERGLQHFQRLVAEHLA